MCMHDTCNMQVSTYILHACLLHVNVHVSRACGVGLTDGVQWYLLLCHEAKGHRQVVNLLQINDRPCVVAVGGGGRGGGRDVKRDSL